MPSSDDTSGRPMERATMATWLVAAASSSTSAHQLLAAIIQQFGRAHVARHQHGIARQAAVGRFLAGQMAQQPPRQIVEIMRPLAQDGIAQALHPQAGFVLHAFHRRFRGQAGAHRIAHALAPALVIGEQAISLDHFAPLARQVEFAERPASGPRIRASTRWPLPAA